MTQANNVAIESSQINSSGVLLTTGGGTGLSTVGTNGQVLTSNGTTLSWVTPTTTSAAGSTGYVQYNNAGAFAGSANVYTDGTRLGVGTTSLSTAARLSVQLVTEPVNISSQNAALCVYRTTNDSWVGLGYASGPDAFYLGASYNATGAYKPLIFATSDTERMRIDTSGNVAINNSTAYARLNVAGNVGFYADNSSNGAQLYLGGSGFYNGSYYNSAPGMGALYDAGTANPGALAFYVYTGSANSRTERLRINISGALGLNGANFGSSGQVLTSGGASAAPTWGAITLPAGTVKQVVSTTYTSRVSQTVSTSASDMTGMSVTITPASTSSKILVLINIAFDAPDNEGIIGLLNRNGTLLAQSTTSPGVQGFFGMATANDGNYRLWSASGNYLDSPATTSALTYKLQSAAVNGTKTWYLNGTGRNSTTDALGSSTITVMEIAG